MLDDFDYFENDIAKFYVPSGYKQMIVNDSILSEVSLDSLYNFIGYHKVIKKYLLSEFVYKVTFYYDNGSIYNIGRVNSIGNLYMTRDCCDTAIDVESNTKYLKFRRNENFPFVEDYDLPYYIEDNQIVVDNYFNENNNYYLKEVLYDAKKYIYGFFSASYKCTVLKDTAKFNKAIESITWKKDNRLLIKRSRFIK
jgi:hypothetical protein